ncbi:kinase-like domain-containing protein [Trichoderma camerunense]
MSQLPDLVRVTRLNTSFQDDFTIHYHDDADDDSRSTWRSEYWRATGHLAQGSCGDVWLQECVRGKRPGGNDQRAVKVLPQLKFRDKHNHLIELEASANFSAKPYSKCFVKFLGWYETSFNLYIAMEYFPLGDLHNYMDKHGPLYEPDAREISFQVLEGLSYMHQEQFAHRDIKPANILIRARPPNSKWWVKISDFGMTKRVEGSKQVMTSAWDTIPYMAPEMLSYEAGSLTFIDHKAADMWALGEMAYRMLTHTAVFPTYDALIHYLETDSFPIENLSKQNASSDAACLIRSLMKRHPDERLTSEKAMDHAWFAPLKNQEDYGILAPTSLVDSSRALSHLNSQPAPIPGPDPWTTVLTNGLQLADSQASAGVPETANGPSTQMLSPFYSRAIEVRRMPARPYKCTYESCPSGKQGFETPAKLARHKKTVHREYNSNDALYICRHGRCALEKEKLWLRGDNFRAHLASHDIHIDGLQGLERYRATSARNPNPQSLVPMQVDRQDFVNGLGGHSGANSIAGDGISEIGSVAHESEFASVFASLTYNYDSDTRDETIA